MQKKNGNLVLRKQSFRWGLMFGLSMGEPLFFLSHWGLFHVRTLLLCSRKKS